METILKAKVAALRKKNLEEYQIKMLAEICDRKESLKLRHQIEMNELEQKKQKVLDMTFIPSECPGERSNY